ncbi:cell division protein ZapA [Sphingomonas flavalba]|uniref:cell division protein ZapA n=1 Tax=Sphingomonas flavalba TaxID=2559804 RepID=UPI00109DA8B7|nr:cell division protein ZapA [Sphingomonas flavalba]
MAEVNLEIGGRYYAVSCRDGEEDHLRRIGQMVDAKAAEASASAGGLNEVRQLLFAALLLADALNDAETARAGVIRVAGAPASGGAAPDPGVALAIERLAERVEQVADRLEGTATST